MAQDLHGDFSKVREVFAEADEALGFPLSEACFSGPEEKLRQTAVTQPAVFVHSVAAWRLLTARGFEPACAAGHSLGEYSALVAAGALDFTAGLELVKRRGQLMQQAGEQRPGSMAAIIGLEDDQVAGLCETAAEVGIAVAANFNAPGQVVVSGEVAAVERLGELAQEAGAKRVIPLPVSGAFHSPLMEPAAREMAVLLRQAQIQGPRVPVITNVSARPVEDPEELRQHLIDQITHPVRWTESMQRLGELGVGKAIEIGPGTVLKGLMRRIQPRLEVLSAGTLEDFSSGLAAAEEPD